MRKGEEEKSSLNAVSCAKSKQYRKDILLLLARRQRQAMRLRRLERMMEETRLNDLAWLLWRKDPAYIVWRAIKILENLEQWLEENWGEEFKIWKEAE